LKLRAIKSLARNDFTGCIALGDLKNIFSEINSDMDIVHHEFSRALSKLENKLWHERGPLQHKQRDCHTLRARQPLL
jgi:hypothetical protein